MPFAEKKKEAEAGGIDVRAELAASLKERGIPEFGEGDDIGRISGELQKHVYAFNDAEARQLIGSVASSWNFVKGLDEKNLDVFINTQENTILTRREIREELTAALGDGAEKAGENEVAASVNALAEWGYGGGDEERSRVIAAFAEEFRKSGRLPPEPGKFISGQLTEPGEEMASLEEEAGDARGKGGGEREMFEIKSREEPRAPEVAFKEGESQAIERRAGEGLVGKVRAYRDSWSREARQMREREEEGGAAAASSPHTEVAKEGEGPAAEEAGAPATGEAVEGAEGRMKAWLSENGFSSAEARDEYDKLKESIETADRRGHSAEVERHFGEMVAQLNGRLGQLRQLREGKGAELEAPIKEELDRYIAKIRKVHNSSMGRFLQSRYLRAGKPTLGESVMPKDEKVREIYAMGKEELADAIVAHMLDEKTEKRTMMGTKSFSSELAGLDELETMAQSAVGEDKKMLYLHVREQSEDLMAMMRKNEGLFKNDEGLLAAFNRRLEEVRRKEAEYAQLAAGEPETGLASAKKERGNEGT